VSYARFSHADVYVYMDVNGALCCCGCSLGDEWYFDTTEAMVAHLDRHRALGHNVPPGIDEDLWEDDAENFPPSCRRGHTWGDPFHPYPDHPHAFRLQRARCSDCGWLTSWPPDQPNRR